MSFDVRYHITANISQVNIVPNLAHFFFSVVPYLMSAVWDPTGFYYLYACKKKKVYICIKSGDIRTRS